MTIKIIITGGTFDKEYNELEGKLFFKDTHLPEMLELARCKLEVDINVLMMIDSAEMTGADRTIILEECQRTVEHNILITHGTDTMIETAEVLANSIKDKTIVLTGAMIPYRFSSSDGLFNLGSSLAFVQTLPHGVYVSMNGKYFRWDNVMKNRQIGVFEQKK